MTMTETKEETDSALTDALFFFLTSYAFPKNKTHLPQLEIAKLDRDLSDLAELVTVDAPHLATGWFFSLRPRSIHFFFARGGLSGCLSTKTEKDQNSLLSSLAPPPRPRAIRCPMAPSLL